MEKNFATYALFVSFFPQLVAGPIERSNNLLPQFKKPHLFDYDRVMGGGEIDAMGLLYEACFGRQVRYLCRCHI